MIFCGVARGHDIGRIGGKYFYMNNGEPYIGMKDTKKPCKHCNRKPTKEGHDACLGTLQNVKFACCGHGNTYEDGVGSAYISFENGKTIRGYTKVRKYLKSIGKKIWHL